jgi:hypothetical protein
VTKEDIEKFCDSYPDLATAIANSLSWGNNDNLASV